MPRTVEYGIQLPLFSSTLVFGGNSDRYFAERGRTETYQSVEAPEPTPDLSPRID